MQLTDAAGLETRVSARFPTGWRFSETEDGYATANRENYHPNGMGKVVVLAQLKRGGYRVGVKKGMGDSWRFDRADLEEAIDTLVEVVQLQEAYRVVRETYPRREQRGWNRIIDARLQALANIGIDSSDEDDPEPLAQSGLDSFTKASEIRA